jgi:hypothetical protein
MASYRCNGCNGQISNPDPKPPKADRFCKNCLKIAEDHCDCRQPKKRPKRKRKASRK